MAASVLTDEQRTKLIEWVVAGFPEPLIRQLFAAHGWKPIASQSVDHYRERHREQIETRRRERLEAAYDSGLAQWEARVKALVEHAEQLAELMWLPDDKGKLHNEKAWRETLDDIAKELGHRRAGLDLDVSRKSDAELIAAAKAAFGGSGPSGTDPPTGDESV